MLLHILTASLCSKRAFSRHFCYIRPLRNGRLNRPRKTWKTLLALIGCSKAYLIYEKNKPSKPLSSLPLSENYPPSHLMKSRLDNECDIALVG